MFRSIVHVCGDSTGAILGPGAVPVFVASGAYGQTAHYCVVSTGAVLGHGRSNFLSWCRGRFHLGVGNLGVVRHVGRLLDGRHGSVPFELVKDGDLLLLIERMLHLRVLTRFGLLRLRAMLMKVWFLTVRFERLTG